MYDKYLVLALLFIFVAAPIGLGLMFLEAISGLLDFLFIAFVIGCIVIGILCLFPDENGYDLDAMQGGLLMLGVGIFLLILMFVL